MTTVRYSPDALLLPDSDADSCPAGVSGRVDCAEQVYDQYYIDFQQVNGRTPVLRDLIAALYREEFGGLNSTQTRSAFGNNFVNSCGSGCNRSQLINWLASKQGWYKHGRQSGSANTSILLNYSSASIRQSYETIADQIVGQSVNWPGACFTTNPNIPCDWANWGLGDQDYYNIRGGVVGTEFCITVQYWLDKNANNNVDTVPTDEWGDYVFAVVTHAQDLQLGDPSTYDYSVTPTWLNDLTKRGVRKNNYYTGISCTGSD